MKRLIDLLLAIPTYFFLSPVIGMVAILARINMGSPVFFTQVRPGLNEKPFSLYKFCTMTNSSDSDGCLLPDSERLSPLGKLLRSTSLDELPELMNVLKGEMSIVGPRPLLMQYLDRYTLEQARRHEVKPGITGWAQVNGRNAITWEDKFRMDVWYVDNWSLKLDLKIIGMTIWSVLRQEGISAEGEATAAEFMGSEQRPEI